MSYVKQGFADGNVLNAAQLNAMDDQISDSANGIDTLTDTEKTYEDEGSFANLIYKTIGLYVDENGDICQKEV